MDKHAIDAVRAVARARKWPEAALLAIVEVESNGVTGAVVNGELRPAIRWEGHYFDRLVRPYMRETARAAGLAHPSAGKVKNPASQAARWMLFDRAARLDRAAAIQSMSWGVGQVMGAHWRKLGYASPDDLFAAACSGIGGQVEMMARFIDKNGLADELERLDWRAFARAYNGSNYRVNRYDEKMAAAYARWSDKLGGVRAPDRAMRGDGMLRMGAKGKAVRELQALLRAAGHAVAVDGDFGPSTKRAVMDFQRANGIAVDGVAGPQTQAALAAWRQPGANPGHLPAKDIPAVDGATKGVGALGGLVAMIAAARDSLAEIAVQLTGIALPAAQTAATWLMATVGALGVALAIWGAAAWVRERFGE